MVAFPLRIRAVFRDGKFVPVEPCQLPESAEVQLTVDRPNVTPPAVIDPAIREAMLDELLKRMQAAALAPDAPKLTRDELHERR